MNRVISGTYSRDPRACYEPEGRVFESLGAHQWNQRLTQKLTPDSSTFVFGMEPKGQTFWFSDMSPLVKPSGWFISAFPLPPPEG